jgi:oligopeptide/dipeptide ABC transporter ATP-binding protein
VSEPLLRVEQLEKHFPLPRGDKVVQACHQVSLDLEAGETLGLIGESGSGKTTVGRCLLRLLEPTAGEIHFRGTRIDQLRSRDFRPYRAKMQIVFQEPFEALNPRMTVGRLLEEPLRLLGVSDRGARRDRVRELLDEVGLGRQRVAAHPAELSAGDQQRVGIARALATRPDFILLDEPTSALPPSATREILGLLRRLQEELGLAYLFISHDLSLVRFFCDRVAVMYLGEIVEIGDMATVFDHAQHPYSRALLDSVLLPDPTRRRRDRAATFRLEGEIPSPVDLPQGCYLASRCPLVRDRCRTEPQALRPVPGGQLARCWRMAEGDVREDELPQRVPAGLERS